MRRRSMSAIFLSAEIEKSRDRWSKCVSHFNLSTFDRRYWLRLNDWLLVLDAFVPGWDYVGVVVLLDISPIGSDKVAIPLVQVIDADLAHQLHAESCRLVFVCVERLHEYCFVGSVLERRKRLGQRRRGPLHTVAEEMQENEALHLK